MTTRSAILDAITARFEAAGEVDFSLMRKWEELCMKKK
jgi:hypothetical protein